MSRTFLCILSAVLLFSCNRTPNANYKDVEFSELFNPIIFSPDSSKITVRYDFPETIQIDSIAGTNFNASIGNKDLLTINALQHTRTELDVLKVYLKGIPFGVPIIRCDSLVYAKTNTIRLVDFNRSYLLFTCKHAASYLAFWNNIPLKVEQEDSLYRIPIPPFSKYTENSHFTIYSLDSLGQLSLAVVPMRKGKIVIERNQLRLQLVSSGIALNTDVLFKHSTSAFHDIIRMYLDRQLKMPTGVLEIYGQYSALASENPDLIKFEVTYFDQSAYVIFNKGQEEAKIELNKSSHSINAKNFLFLEK